MKNNTTPESSRYGSIEELVANALTKDSEHELNEEQLNLLRLCRLLVKVEYRYKYVNNSMNKDTNEL
jgi:hypothetical protein